eukprot:6192851-Pleurochrysis_carterae.AAC.1
MSCAVAAASPRRREVDAKRPRGARYSERGGDEPTSLLAQVIGPANDGRGHGTSSEGRFTPLTPEQWCTRAIAHTTIDIGRSHNNHYTPLLSLGEVGPARYKY